jgi:hypothetical protein
MMYMHYLDFCQWLRGFAEMTEGAPNEKQWAKIKDRLNGVFENKITPQGGWTDNGGQTTPAPAPPVIEDIKSGRVPDDGWRKCNDCPHPDDLCRRHGCGKTPAGVPVTGPSDEKPQGDPEVRKATEVRKAIDEFLKHLHEKNTEKRRQQPPYRLPGVKPDVDPIIPMTPEWPYLFPRHDYLCCH